MTDTHDIAVTDRARVYAEGWQSWSPTTWYRRGEPPHRPDEGWQHLMRFRPEKPVPEGVLQGEGLLVVDPGDGGPAEVFAAVDASERVPTIRAEWRDDRVVVTAGDGVERWKAPVADDPGTAALAEFGSRFGAAAGARTGSRVPRVWCTWYQYFEEVTAADVAENLRALDAGALGEGVDVDLVQIDDGWSLGTGEWTAPHPRFGDLGDVVAAVRASGRRAGVWLAPFSVGSRSDLAQRHPDWLTSSAGYNWGDELVGLDLTHPGVRDYLTEVFTRLRDLGADYLKLDFLYAGAVPAARHEDVTPVAAYRSGLQLIRDVMGEDAYLLGCGAPLLPSVGLVDAMRISPDTFHEGGEDGSQGLRGRMSLEARTWQDGRLYTTDPDCLVARPAFVLRDAWAEVVLAAPGVRGFSDRIADLDEHGRELVRELLKEEPA
jgi:alpha-galactosidase